LKSAKEPGILADDLEGPQVFTQNQKGGIKMGPEIYMLMCVSLIDLWWWLRK
jgi:hypothetical protein